MSRAKREIEEREEAAFDAAERDGRTCPFCGEVIPFGTDPGEHGECPACVGALRDE